MDPFRFVLLINIPSPYRLHLQRVLNQRLAERSWMFEVYFMAHTEANRFWEFSDDDFDFPHRFGRGIHPILQGSSFHFNPDLIWALFKNPPDKLLICGGWFLPTVVCSILILKFLGKTKIYFWAESNLNSLRFSGRLISILRSKMFQLIDVFVLPGELARQYLHTFGVDTQNKKLAYLPNAVDETLYRDEVFKLRVGKKHILKQLGFAIPQPRILVTLARLISVKGIIELLTAVLQLDHDIRKGLYLFIVGDGEQRAEIEAFIKENGLASNVRLAGHLDQTESLKYYAVADGFILPSLKDPSPLAAIEAALAGLPLLLSKNVGNHPELLQDGVNGWLFDPSKPETIAEILHKFISASRADLQQMGEISTVIGTNRFSTEKLVSNFLGSIIE
jgi:glycosyltransferase involved in cell wall biosynthesis